MALVKKLQKIGNARCLILTVEILALMGLEDGDDVVLEMVGDALLVRKLGVERPETLNVLLALEALGNIVQLKPDHPTAGTKILTDNRQRLLQYMREHGPSTVTEFVTGLAMSDATVHGSLRRLVEAELVHKSDGRPARYGINESAFIEPE